MARKKLSLEDQHKPFLLAICLCVAMLCSTSARAQLTASAYYDNSAGQMRLQLMNTSDTLNLEFFGGLLEQNSNTVLFGTKEKPNPYTPGFDYELPSFIPVTPGTISARRCVLEPGKDTTFTVSLPKSAKVPFMFTWNIRCSKTRRVNGKHNNYGALTVKVEQEFNDAAALAKPLRLQVSVEPMYDGKMLGFDVKNLSQGVTARFATVPTTDNRKANRYDMEQGRPAQSWSGHSLFEKHSPDYGDEDFAAEQGKLYLFMRPGEERLVANQTERVSLPYTAKWSVEAVGVERGKVPSVLSPVRIQVTDNCE